MKTNGKTVKGSVRAMLRALAERIENPVWANATPYGPGGLVTGQAGAAGRNPGPYISQRLRDEPGCPDAIRPADLDFAAWI